MHVESRQGLCSGMAVSRGPIMRYACPRGVVEDLAPGGQPTPGSPRVARWCHRGSPSGGAPTGGGGGRASWLGGLGGLGGGGGEPGPRTGRWYIVHTAGTVDQSASLRWASRGGTVDQLVNGGWGSPGGLAASSGWGREPGGSEVAWGGAQGPWEVSGGLGTMDDGREICIGKHGVGVWIYISAQVGPAIYIFYISGLMTWGGLSAP
jgi:hypothetical protein